MKLLYVGCIYLCFLMVAVIAVIPPHILARARLNRHRGSRLTLLRENLHRSVVTFTPTGIKCCKLGEKAAKKKLSCHIHDPSRKRNMIHHKIKSTYSSSRIIIGKAEKCGVKYGKPFETCCSYREDFYRDMHRCKINFTEREDRRQCRSLVREKYTWCIISEVRDQTVYDLQKKSL